MTTQTTRRTHRSHKLDADCDCGVAADEIDHLRAVIRVNALRSNQALTHEEIERVIEGR